MALPLGSVKGTRETLRRPLHHSGAALPAKRDVQKRFLSGGCLSDSFDGDVETLMKFTNSEVEGFACAHRLSCADGWCRRLFETAVAPTGLVGVGTRRARPMPLW